MGDGVRIFDDRISTAGEIEAVSNTQGLKTIYL
jgi:hypothetical protein